MNIEKMEAVIIPAEKIEENDTTVVITYQGKRTIINHAAILNDSAQSGTLVYAKIMETKLGTVVDPICSENTNGYFLIDNSLENKGVHSFTIEEFVDIYLNNLEVRTAVSNGKYTFYRDNLIPTNWTFLEKEDFNSAIKKIQNKPVLSKQKINDKEVYQLDDFASRIKVFTSDDVDDIIEGYALNKNDDDTVGLYLNHLMKKKGIISARLYEMTAIDKSTLSEYLNDGRNQQKNYLVAISIALRLLPVQSSYLLELADICIGKHSVENRLYRLFLDSCAFNMEITVAKCNEILISRGLSPLTNLRIMK